MRGQVVGGRNEQRKITAIIHIIKIFKLLIFVRIKVCWNQKFFVVHFRIKSQRWNIPRTWYDCNGFFLSLYPLPNFIPYVDLDIKNRIFVFLTLFFYKKKCTKKSQKISLFFFIKFSHTRTYSYEHLLKQLLNIYIKSKQKQAKKKCDNYIGMKHVKDKIYRYFYGNFYNVE